MTPVGRNDPCPCGSGKKYKHCHGSVMRSTPEEAYDSVRRIDTEARDLLMKYVTEVIHPKTAEDPWTWYTMNKPLPRTIDEPGTDPFIRWVLFSWRPEGQPTVAEQFLAERRGPIDERLHRFIHTTTRTPYSFYQVVSMEPGRSVLLRDLLRSGEVLVTERTASLTLRSGYIILARVVEFESVTFFMGVYAQPLEAQFIGGVLALRRDLEKRARRIRKRAITTGLLLDDEGILRGLYFRWAELQAERKIDLRNTDGDPFSFHTLTFEIPSLDEAFEALKELEQRVTEATDDDILKEGERTADGRLKEVVLHWVRAGSKTGMGDTTSLAMIRIGRTRMVVEVNSERRSKMVQKEIAMRMGSRATLLKVEVLTQEEMMRRADRMEAKPPRVSKEEDALKNSPEVQEAVRQMMAKHWAEWPDIPIPALNGMTPRTAAKSPRGRELLESLLLDFEGRNMDEPDDMQRVDVAALRKELGMD